MPGGFLEELEILIGERLDIARQITVALPETS